MAVSDRAQRALLIAASLGTTGYQQLPSGEFLVPSTRCEGAFYLTTPTSCTCPDARFRQVVCKHQISIHILRVLERADAKNEVQEIAA